MPRVLPVFASMDGDTESVARAIVGGVATGVPVDVVEGGAAPVVLDRARGTGPAVPVAVPAGGAS